jgi:hypothetical protein
LDSNKTMKIKNYSKEIEKSTFFNYYVFGLQPFLSYDRRKDRNGEDVLLGGARIVEYNQEKFPVHFQYVKGDLILLDCKKLKTLKNFISQFEGQIKVDNCPLLDLREVEIVNDTRLRKLWNESILNLDEFCEEHRGTFSSKKFGF